MLFHLKNSHGFVTKTATCKCGLVNMKEKNCGFYGNSPLRDMHAKRCNEKHLKNSFENHINDEF